MQTVINSRKYQYFKFIKFQCQTSNKESKHKQAFYKDSHFEITCLKLEWNLFYVYLKIWKFFNIKK